MEGYLNIRRHGVVITPLTSQITRQSGETPNHFTFRDLNHEADTVNIKFLISIVRIAGTQTLNIWMALWSTAKVRQIQYNTQGLSNAQTNEQHTDANIHTENVTCVPNVPGMDCGCNCSREGNFASSKTSKTHAVYSDERWRWFCLMLEDKESEKKNASRLGKVILCNMLLN
jgi:hypothetical protein